MNIVELLTKEEIESYGFIYEPDATKCKSRKLHLYVPSNEMINDDYKLEIAKQITFKYVNRVYKAPNPYEGDPDFLSDPKVIVSGHTVSKNPP